MFGKSTKAAQPQRPKQPKESFVARMRRRGRETKALGHTLINEPRAFPRQAGGLFKRMFRTMWEARGGGFYACGFVISFIWLEINTLIDEIASADGFIEFFTEQFLEFLMRFSAQSITNTVLSFLWPLLVIDRLGPISVALLLAGYLAFARFIKPVLTAWLFDDGMTAAAPDDAMHSVTASRNKDQA